MEAIVMVNRNDVDRENLLQQVIEHLRRQEVPEFPNPEIRVSRSAKERVSSARPISTLRRMAMNRRLQLSAGAIVGLAAVLGFVLLWGGGTAQQASAMEKMAESVRIAKSFKFVMVHRFLPPAPATVDYTSTVYWRAPNSPGGTGSMRFEMKRPKGWKGQPGEIIEPVWIQVPGRPILNIEHQTKTFCRYSSSSKTTEWSLCESLQDLGKLSGEADRQLGVKKIGGKKVRGFEIDNQKVNPNNVPGPVEIWIDAETNLPVSIHHKSQIDGNYGEVHFNAVQFTDEIADIQWNLPFDAKLFDTAPPKGYTNTTPKRPTSREEIRQIVVMLEYYAKTNGGRYPSANRVESLMPALDKWFQDIKRRQPRNNYFTKELEEKLDIAGKGAMQIENIEVNDPDAVYYGKTVKPGDKEKVLLRWKLEDGRYQVIFGDLRAEAVTVERLRTLEGK
jgi:hypothetical protein